MKNKNLLIGLGVAGGIAAVVGVVGTLACRTLKASGLLFDDYDDVPSNPLPDEDKGNDTTPVEDDATNSDDAVDAESAAIEAEPAVDSE